MTKIVPTSPQRSANMRAVKASGSQIEVMLAKALWAKGYRYRKNCKNVFGKPDFVLKKHKMVIFCDSEFWHGKDWNNKKKEIHSNIKFWHTKIESNIQRDKVVTKQLKKEGWKVLRFWGKDIEKHIERCLNRVDRAVKK